MLMIIRKFKVEIHKDHCDEFEDALNEMCIEPDYKLCDACYKVTYRFTETQETMDELMEYLRKEYTGVASIIY